MRRSRSVLLLLAAASWPGFALADEVVETKITTVPSIASTVQTSPPPPSPLPAPPAPTPPAPAAGPSRFRLGLTYTHVIEEDGDLVNENLATNAFGIDLASPSDNYVRDHLGLAYQWESFGAYSARGFRIDLVSLGYPIHLDDSPKFRLDVEPILTVLRGEIMFVTGGKFLRMESGFGVELSATWNHWFVDVQPFEVDFRYWVYSSRAPTSSTGLGRLFPFRLAVGHEF